MHHSFLVKKGLLAAQNVKLPVKILTRGYKITHDTVETGSSMEKKASQEFLALKCLVLGSNVFSYDTSTCNI